jgi:NADH-quinone oxidoreductase subunit N
MDVPENRGELYALILFSTLGMILMAKGIDLLIIFLGLELLSISLYVLVGFFRNRLKSNESGLKYLLLGAFSSGFLLYGIVFVFGVVGSTQLQAIKIFLSTHEILEYPLLLMGMGLLIVGFSFKVALAPFHMWSPDVYEGAPTAITAFLSTGPKAAGFAAFVRVFSEAFSGVHGEWEMVLWVLAVTTMTIGNISALVQTNMKRLLAYSSIAHAGYLAVGVLVASKMGTSAILYYLMAYTLMNIGAFAFVIYFERGEDQFISIDDYAGLGFAKPLLALPMALIMFSLAGIPPTAGFVGKYYLFSSAVQNGYIWLTVIGVLNSLLSVYYYLRVVVVMFMKPMEKERIIQVAYRPALIITLLITGYGILHLGIFPQSFWNLSWLSAISIY